MELLLLLLLLASPLHASVPCGTRLSDPSYQHGKSRIIGGNNVTTVGRWPWQISFGFDQPHKHMCGASIISERWLLTAAHCVRIVQDHERVLEVKSGYAAGAIIRVGAETNEDAIMLEVSETFPIATYNPHAYPEDIALLKLSKPLTFDHRLSPVCLPSPTQSIPSDGYAIATGFGWYNDRGTDNITRGANMLREVIVPIVRRDICNDRWREVMSIDDIHGICVGSMGHGASKGDSGGPLVMEADDGRWFQIGLTSIGIPTSVQHDTIPNVYTDVRHYCEWIEETTGGEAKCQQEEVTLKDVEIQ